MLVKLDNPGLFVKGVEILSELVTEVKIKLNDFGMSITAIDPANVAMTRLRIPKSSFSKFEVGDDTLEVNLENLKRILRRCGAGSSLTLERKENILNIQIQDRINRNFGLSLIEFDAEEKEIPSLEFSCRVDIDSVDFISSIEDCSVVADACSFIIQDGKFIVEAKGLDFARSEFSSDEAKIEAENSKSRYSLEYLQKFLKASKLSKKTILKFANDHPLRLEIKEEGFELDFILAPRIETED